MSGPEQARAQPTIERLIESARQRPSMYAPSGYYVLDEAIAQAVRAHEAGVVHTLRVELGPDGGITIEDDGPSVPVTERGGAAVIDDALGGYRDFASGDRDGSRVEGACISLGLWLVRALATEMTVESRSRGHAVAARFVRGAPEEQRPSLCAIEDRATRIRYRLDGDLVRDHATLDPLKVAARLADLAAVYPDLTISFASRLTSGLAGRLRQAVALYHSAHPLPFERRWTDGAATVDVALMLLRQPTGTLHLLANGRPFERGTPRTALVRVIEDRLPPRKGAPRARSLEHVAVVLSVRSPDVLMRDSTRSLLSAPDLQASTAREIGALFDDIARAAPDALDACRAAVKAAR